MNRLIFTVVVRMYALAVEQYSFLQRTVSAYEKNYYHICVHRRLRLACASRVAIVRLLDTVDIAEKILIILCLIISAFTVRCIFSIWASPTHFTTSLRRKIFFQRYDMFFMGTKSVIIHHTLLKTIWFFLLFFFFVVFFFCFFFYFVCVFFFFFFFLFVCFFFLFFFSVSVLSSQILLEMKFTGRIRSYLCNYYNKLIF